MVAKRTWVALGVLGVALLIWVLIEPITNFVGWLWGMEATERGKIKDVVQIVAGGAGVGSFLFAAINFLKGQKNAPKDSKDLLRVYYEVLYKSCEKIDLSLVDEKFTEYARSVKGSVTLPVVYQEMDVLPCRAEKEASDETEKNHLRGLSRQPLLQAVAEDKYRQVVVLGDAGAGKSMFMDNLAWYVSGSHLGKTHEKLPKTFRYLPIIRVRFRAAAWLCKQAGIAEDQLLLQAMEHSVTALVGSDTGKATWEALKPTLLERGIILLDGVDEVPETDGLRYKMLEAIDWLMKELKPEVHLVITSRPYVFENENAHWLQTFACLELQLMQNEQVEQFINNWYLLLREARDYSPDAALREAHQLFADLLDRDDLLDFARNPLLLTLLASLHFASGILPHSRAELFDKAIALMLERWTQRSRRENPDYPLDDFERKALRETESSRKAALQALALSAHENKTLHISGLAIKGLFSGYISSDCNPNNLLDFIRYRSGILRPSDGENLSFYHRLFQAYLAALAITDMDNWQDVLDEKIRSDKDWWKEVFLLLISAKVMGNSKPDVISFLFSYYIHESIDYQNYPEDQWQYLLLAAEALIEQKKPLQSYTKPQYLKLINVLIGHLRHVVECEYTLPIALRAQAGRLLGEIGDPREGVGVVKNADGTKLPDIDWVTIPAGTFRMGTDGDEGYSDEKPAHQVTLAAFAMSRYPVTNAQFACFVAAGGYDDERYWRSCEAAYQWWKGEKADLSLLDDDPKWKRNYENWLATEKTRRQPWFWDEQRWNNPNHPVVGVNWYEALAFCEWLNSQAEFMGKVRLPTEAEWEYAARGAECWRYAWGNDADATLGNYRDTELGQTSAVGLFPAGKAFGLCDMSGNVWEWTTSQWGKKTASPDFTYAQWEEQEGQRDCLDIHALRVLRGGSWYGNAQYLRSADRDGSTPDYRSSNGGFRLVLGQ